MLSIVPILCVVLGLAASSPSANQYVNNVLSTSYPAEVRNLRLEPAYLKDFNAYFGKAGPVASGTANFTGGQMKGLSLARPYSECVGPRTVKGLLTINCTVSLTSFQTSYNGRVKNGSSPIYNIRAEANLTDTLVYLVIGGQAPYYIGQVKSFQVQRVAGIVPRFIGLPSNLVQYSGQIGNAYVNLVYPQLMDIVQQSFIYALNNALSRTPMPRS